MGDRHPKNKHKLQQHRSGNGNGGGDRQENASAVFPPRNVPGNRIRRKKPWWCQREPGKGGCLEDQGDAAINQKCKACPHAAKATA